MAVSKDQFKQFIRPQPGELVLYVNNGYDVEAINISNKLNAKINVYEDLKPVTTMSLEVNNAQREFHIVSSSLFVGISGSYWSYEVRPLDISATGSSNTVEVDIIPRPSDYRFKSSEYNFLESSATENRTNSFAYDVDYSSGISAPVNKAAILNNAATLAQYQDLNYTATGLTRGRYEGSKTTVDDYGVSPSISATPFNAAIYPLNLSNAIICSQSLQERKIEPLLFTFDSAYFDNALADAGINELDVDNLVNPTPRRNLISTDVNQFFFGANPTTATKADIEVTGSVNLANNDLLLYSGSNGQEYLRVNTVTYNGGNNLSTINVNLLALQKYGETDIYPQGGRANRSGGAVADDILYKIASDTVFSTDQNQLFKVVNKKIFNAVNKEIAIVDDNGKVILISTTCQV